MNYSKLRQEILLELQEEKEKSDNILYLEQMQEIGIEVLN